MAKQKLKIPKRVAGVKIKKRHRKQLRALVRRMDQVEELLAVGTALTAMLGIGKHMGKKDKADDRPASLTH
jgi:hypothetical protein